MKRFFLLVILCAAVVHVHAKVTLPSVVGDNMVLQQQTDAALWGHARPNAKVTITTTWSKAKVDVFSDENGEWKTVYETSDNHQRFIKEKLDITAKAVRFIPLSTYRSERMVENYGSSVAHVFNFEVF